jgi:hypothetical protein
MERRNPTPLVDLAGWFVLAAVIWFCLSAVCRGQDYEPVVGRLH